MDTSIFKSYDIRGLYPSQINKNTAYNIGRAFGIFVKDFYKIEKPTIIVGYDIRNSSEELFSGLTQALIEQGVKVIDIGLCTTPLNYFANWHLETDASVMITASHDPKDYNGFKLSLREVMALAEKDGIERLKELVAALPARNVSPDRNVISTAGWRSDAGGPAAPSAAPPTPPGQGAIEHKDILNDYLDFLAEKAKGADFSRFRVAVDCGNGMVGPIFEKLAKRIGLDYKGLFMEPDGDFPNHQPNPLDEDALKALKELMGKEKFDLGIIFDGDGDRFMVLDSAGKLIRTGFLLGLFAQYFLPKIENKKIPCDARIGRGEREFIQQAGGQIKNSQVGYPHLKKLMRKEQAFLGGELSSHFFWQDFSYSESALLTMIRLLKLLTEKKQPIDKLVDVMRKYFNSGELNFEVEDKEGMLKKIEKEFISGDISKLDGLTVEYRDWWFNIRPSNTEPFLRLVVEAETKELLEEKLKKLTQLIAA